MTHIGIAYGNTTFRHVGLAKSKKTSHPQGFWRETEKVPSKKYQHIQ